MKKERNESKKSTLISTMSNNLNSTKCFKVEGEPIATFKNDLVIYLMDHIVQQHLQLLRVFKLYGIRSVLTDFDFILHKFYAILIILSLLLININFFKILLLCVLNTALGFDCTHFCTIFLTFIGIGVLKQFGVDSDDAASFFIDTINVQIPLQTPRTTKTKNFNLDINTSNTWCIKFTWRNSTAIAVESEGYDGFDGQLIFCLS